MHQSVIVVTWRRPDHVTRCLAALAGSTQVPDEVIVVDASEDSATADAVSRSALGLRGVAIRLGFPGGAGHMTTARNVGLLHAHGDVISFLDDDVRVSDGWSAAVCATMRTGVQAVAGRVSNGEPGESVFGAIEIGTLRDDGSLTGNFAADPGSSVPVLHGIGANMSFSRDVLAALGGFRDLFPGTAMREDTDVFLRIKALDGRTLFSPDALVHNDSGPHVVGKRFDLRYVWWAEHNHGLLLVLNFGLGAGALTWRYVRSMTAGLITHESERRASNRLLRAAARVAGLALGVARGAWLIHAGNDPRRLDREGQAITRHLQQS